MFHIPGFGFNRPVGAKHPNWVLSQGRYAPPNAVVAGVGHDGEPFYVGRTLHGNNLIPGKVKLSQGKCYVPFGGQEHSSSNYEILVQTEDIMFDWLPASNGAIPAGAIIGGYKSDGKRMFVGRALHNNKQIPGKVNVENKCIYIADGGREISYNSYEVLVCRMVDL
ncbi:DgyrCDS1710 [Dimorphilus gyrociliatus]|uniref:DgyrCDS1710 n=1 Tax=Dimorphilus gyrociliatus TaxID=2664684 RepID=A0A7I8VAZ6_9ANNE|nr:DgyrCDS1710 [Dimorphilus gyrociliatus]